MPRIIKEESVLTVPEKFRSGGCQFVRNMIEGYGVDINEWDTEKQESKIHLVMTGEDENICELYENGIYQGVFDVEDGSHFHVD